jgi:hypothetical protein
MNLQDKVKEEKWLTLDQAAALVGKSRPTISVWIIAGRRKAGKLPFVTVGPRNSKLIQASVLLAYAKLVQRPGYPAGKPRSEP